MRSNARIANEAWEALFRAQATIAGELAAGTDWGELLPREYGVLYALSTAPNGLRITELGEDVLLTQPGMSRLVARLEARGLVWRGDDPDDARACRVRLTSAGAELQRTVGLGHGRLVAQAMTRRLDRRAASATGRPLPPVDGGVRASPSPPMAGGRPRRSRWRDDRVHGEPARARPPETAPRRVIVISAGTGEPSSTRMLADRIAQRTLELLRETGIDASAGVIELAPLAVDIASATVAGFPSEQLQAAIEQIAGADAIIAATPVYKAGISGLFKSFIDVLDDDLLIAKPVLLAATAGSSRHALVVDEQMRPLFAYMRALTLPTSVFASPEDWGAAELGDRIGRAATELAVLDRSPGRAADHRPPVVRLPAPVRRQRNPRRADRRRPRLRLATDASRGRRTSLTSEAPRPRGPAGARRPRLRRRAPARVAVRAPRAEAHPRSGRPRARRASRPAGESTWRCTGQPAPGWRRRRP